MFLGGSEPRAALPSNLSNISLVREICLVTVLNRPRFVAMNLPLDSQARLIEAAERP